VHADCNEHAKNYADAETAPDGPTAPVICVTTLICDSLWRVANAYTTATKTSGRRRE
jgi:hypothetical protein